MQISRHWRMNQQRYRLVGRKYENGVVSLQGRPQRIEVQLVKNEQHENRKQAPAVAVASVG